MNYIFDSIPEALLMNIASHTGGRVIGLSDQYIVDEIRSLDVNYGDISRRAEELGLSNLLKYICTPFNIDQVISLHNLKHHGLTPEGLYIYDKIDWRPLIRLLTENDMNIHILSGVMGDEIEIPAAARILQKISAVSPITPRRDDIHVMIATTPEETRSFLWQVYASKPEASMDKLIPATFRIGESALMLPELERARLVQDMLVESLKEFKHGDHHTDDVDLMYWLNQQRRKRDIINAILDYEQPIDVHGVHLDIEELRVLDLLISLQVPLEFDAIPPLRMIYITVFSERADIQQRAQEKLGQVFGQSNVEVRREREGHYVNERTRYCITVPGYERNWKTKDHILEGETEDIRYFHKMVYAMDMLHCPVNMARSNIRGKPPVGLAGFSFQQPHIRGIYIDSITPRPSLLQPQETYMAASAPRPRRLFTTRSSSQADRFEGNVDDMLRLVEELGSLDVE